VRGGLKGSKRGPKGDQGDLGGGKWRRVNLCNAGPYRKPQLERKPIQMGEQGAAKRGAAAALI